MTLNNYIWKVWIKLNLLTKDKSNDYTAEVSTVGNTARNPDIVQAIIDEGSEIKADTLLSILNQGDRIKRTIIAESRSVQDGVCHITPRVYGVRDGANAKFDAELNSIGLEITTATEMRDLLKSVKVESLGVKSSGAYIKRIIDVITGISDETVTPDEIEGDRIKILLDDEDGNGVFCHTGVSVPVINLLYN
jgi:hypothetical protein